MHNASNQLIDYPQLLHQAYQDALQKNEEAEKHWQNVTKEYETLESHLADLPKTLTKEVMVPVAPRAIMPGKIVHSNEILVGMGQGYFVMRSAAQAVEICNRRRKMCTDMLEKLEKERELLVGRSELPMKEEAFAGVNEIIEESNEEEVARWKVEHRLREKEYRQKLAELKEKDQTKIEDYDSLWKRLDELELQEELEEELDRLHAYDSDDDEEDETEEEENTEGQSGEQEPTDFIPTISERDITRKNGLKQRSSEYSTHPEAAEEPSEPTSKRRVSFVDPKEHQPPKDETEDNEDNDDVTLKIEFKHSSYVPPKPDTINEPPIQSPGDIYTHFKGQFLSQPKSILKKSSSYPLVNEPSIVDNARISPEPSCSGDGDNKSIQYVPLPHPVANEVVERDVTITEKIVQPISAKPVSKFKASRQRKKR